MTNLTPTLGNAPGLPEYLSNLQTQAMRLTGLLSVIGFLNNDGNCEDGLTALIDVAEQLSNELDIALDSANLPRGHCHENRSDAR